MCSGSSSTTDEERIEQQTESSYIKRMKEMSSNASAGDGCAMRHIPTWCIASKELQYINIKKLGEGQFGEVKEVLKKGTRSPGDTDCL